MDGKGCIAVVVADGPSMLEYNPGDWQGAFILMANASWFNYRQLTGIDPQCSLVMAMDRPSSFNGGRYEKFKQIPESVPMLLQSQDWLNKQHLGNRANVEVRMATRAHLGNKKHFWRESVCGTTTGEACIYEAIKRGYSKVYVFGHDYSREWQGFTERGAFASIRHLNFANELASEKGGFVSLHSNSYLWEIGNEELKTLKHGQ